MLRVQRATHARVAVYADRLGCPMAQVIEDAVDVYGRLQEKGLRMHEKLTFYVIYVDAKPLYIVGAVSADAAVQGFRENMLGKVQFTQLQAVEATEAPFEDMARMTLLAVLTQVSQFNQALAAMAQQQPRGGRRLVQ